MGSNPQVNAKNTKKMLTRNAERQHSSWSNNLQYVGTEYKFFDAKRVSGSFVREDKSNRNIKNSV